MHQYRHKAVLFLMLCVTITYAYGLLIWAIETLFHVGIDQSGVTFERTFSCFFISGVVAPLLETFLFQQLPYDAFVKRKWPEKWLVVFSALIFGLAHAYSVAYVILATIQGVVFMYAYITWDGTRISKYWMVTFIHAFHNIFFFLLQLIFG
jgi:uncharacterized protein